MSKDVVPYLQHMIENRIKELDTLIPALQHERDILNKGAIADVIGAPSADDPARHKRKRMSAAARKATSIRMRKYWAQRRKEKKAA